MNPRLWVGVVCSSKAGGGENCVCPGKNCRVPRLPVGQVSGGVGRHVCPINGHRAEGGSGGRCSRIFLSVQQAGALLACPCPSHAWE